MNERSSSRLPTDLGTYHPADRGHGNRRAEADPTLRPRVWSAAWRQHRAWVIGALGLALVGGLVLATAVITVPACASTAWWETPGATCNARPARVLWKLFRGGMAVLPVLVGVILGAVTFGPDVEHRTHIFALTQDVGRPRWWLAKVTVMSVPAFVALTMLGMATLWAIDSSTDAVVTISRLTSPGFQILGLVPACLFLVAYSGAAAGALIWRTLGGVVAGLVVAFVVVVGGIALQPLVVPHDRTLIPFMSWMADQTGELSVADSDSAYGWGGYADAQGSEIDTLALDCGELAWTNCLFDNGVSYRLETFVSTNQYPRMMLTISGMDLLIAAGLFGIGARWLRRRDL